MGQKVHPGGMRVGVIHDWKSNWFAGTKEFPEALLEDIKIREHIYNKLSHAGLSDVLIRKDKQRITIDIYTARPGIVIGKSGAEVDALRKEIHAMTHKNVHININEIKRPELDAKLVAQSIAEQLQNRVSFRRAMKRSLASAMRSGAHGVKVQCGGRLGGTEMSRSESYSEGRVPLHTIRADIDYGFVEAKTTSRPDRREGLDQQGRDHARGLRERRPAEGDAARRPGHGAPPRWAHRRVSRPRARADATGRRTARVSARCGRGARGAERRADAARSRTASSCLDRRGAARGEPRGSPRLQPRGCRHPSDARKPTRKSRRGGELVMLLPKKTKYRKQQRGRRAGVSKGQTRVQFGDFGLKSMEAAWVTNRQIEAARIAMTRKIKRGGKVWINVFPDKPVSQKPAETRMGSGKGAPGALGRRRQARPGHVRAGRGARGPGQGSAAPGRHEAAGEDEVREAGG